MLRLRFGLVCWLALLSGCSAWIAPKVEITGPTTAKAPEPAKNPPLTGSIWADAPQRRSLFEDRRPMYVGDLVTVNIEERLQASQNSTSKASRAGSVSGGVTRWTKLPFPNALPGLDLSGNSNTEFEGGGESSSSNRFTGTLTATVVEVLSNGNLRIAGEKQIGIGQDVETVKLTGIISPTAILAGNRVSSLQIADARMDYRGKGQINEARGAGWLTRFFMNVSPF